MSCVPDLAFIVVLSKILQFFCVLALPIFMCPQFTGVQVEFVAAAAAAAAGIAHSARIPRSYCQHKVTNTFAVWTARLRSASCLAMIISLGSSSSKIRDSRITRTIHRVCYIFG